jgi:cytochrome c peroxidase
MLVVLSAGFLEGAAAATNGWDARALARLQSPPLGLPAVPVPRDNPPTREKIALGRKLFLDRRLSFNQTMSCAMCHIPEQGFSNNELATPIGVEGRSLRRNAPTILNVAYSERLFHDGREGSLETQAIDPILARDEMAAPSAGWIVEKVRSLPDYAGSFERAFGKAASVDTLGQALASWQRTLLAADSSFDRWRYGGEANALTPEQQRGFALFTSKANCAQCHFVGEKHALFTDQKFHNTGIAQREEKHRANRAPVPLEIAPGVVIDMDRKAVESVGQVRPADLGRFEITLEPEDRWRFRTPSLRNVALTAPYMHDGSLRTLREVVEYYNGGGTPHSELDPRVRPLGLSESEKGDLVSFLESLTGANLDELIADARSAPVGN